MRLLRRHDRVGPVLVVLAVYLAAVGAQLVRYDGDPTGFVQFGSEAAAVIGPPPDAYVLAGTVGYDGQAWQGYAAWRFGGEIPWTTPPSDLWGAPGAGLAAALPELLAQPAREAAWDLAYVGLCAAAVPAALLAVRRERGPEALFCLGQAALVVLLGEVFWIDHWSFTRVTAPLFASLLLAGVTSRSRPATAVACAAAVLTILIPATLNTETTFERR